MYFRYIISIEVLTGHGHDTRTEVLEEGFIEAPDAEVAQQQLTGLLPLVLGKHALWLEETLLGGCPSVDDLTITVEPFDLDAHCAETRRRIQLLQQLTEEDDAPDAFLEMQYEDRYGCGLEE